MYKGKTVGVVVPAYNEAGFVGEVIDTLPSFVDRAYVIDDRSTDGTWEEIKRHAAEKNATQVDRAIADGGRESKRIVEPVRHDENRGVGGAIKTGYRMARDEGMDVTAVMNGDGQMDPDILDEIIDPVAAGNAHYAKGNRLLDPSHREEMSRFRLFGNVILTFLTKIASGYWRMMDPQNGYTAIDSEALEAIDIDGLYEEYGFLNDLLVKLNTKELRIVDVPMRAAYGEETSGIRYSRFIPRVSGLLLRDFLWRLKIKYVVFDFHPLVLLYALGTLGAAAGTLHAGWLLAADGPSSYHAPIALLLWLLVGTLFSLAMTFDRYANVHLDAGPLSRARDEFK